MYRYIRLRYRSLTDLSIRRETNLMDIDLYIYKWGHSLTSIWKREKEREREREGKREGKTNNPNCYLNSSPILLSLLQLLFEAKSNQVLFC